MTHWWNLALEVDGADAPALAELLERLGAMAVSLQAADETVLAVAAVEPERAQHWPRTKVTALLPAERDPDALLAELEAQAPQWIAGGATRERFADRDWMAAFRQRFAPMRFGRLGVRASWSPAFGPGVAEVVIDPGMAFGTGAHPSTALCLAALAAGDLAGRSVVDYGCGSGVLAIAAVKLGAARVRAVDLDPQACEVAAANAAANACRDCIALGPPERLGREPADLVVANILLEPLLELAPALLALLGPRGQLLLSGITEAQLPRLRQRYAGALEAVTTRTQDGWALLSGRRPGTAC